MCPSDPETEQCTRYASSALHTVTDGYCRVPASTHAVVPFRECKTSVVLNLSSLLYSPEPPDVHRCPLHLNQLAISQALSVVGFLYLALDLNTASGLEGVVWQQRSGRLAYLDTTCTAEKRRVGCVKHCVAAS